MSGYLSMDNWENCIFAGLFKSMPSDCALLHKVKAIVGSDHFYGGWFFSEDVMELGWIFRCFAANF